MFSLIDLYLCSLIALFLMIPILTVIFCILRADLKLKRIFFSFSSLILILGVGLISNYSLILQALKDSPIIGFIVFFFIISTIISLVMGYQEVLSISGGNTMIWTKRSFHQALLQTESVPNYRDRITSIVEYSPISVLILDEKLEIVGVNSALLNFLGYKEKEVAVLNLEGIFCPLKKGEDDLEEVLKKFRRGKLEFIRKLRKKDGGIIYGKLIVYFIKNDNKEDGYHVIMQILDMTREVELQQKTSAFNTLLQDRVAKQTRILNKKNKSLEYLNHAMSHDLKAPIKNLEGLFGIYLELNKVNDEKDREKCAKHIQTNIKRMDKIIADLSLFFDTQRKEIHKINYNPRHQIEEIIEIYANGLYSNLTIEIKIDKLPMFFADQDIFFHVWQNLIVNAIKYASKKGVVRLHISGHKKEGRTIFSIQDNGIGFSNEEKNLLFKPFKRLSNSKGFSGTGLGLPIVKEIIDRHEGEIWAESTEGKNSTFYISLLEKESTEWHGEEKYDNLLSQEGVRNDVAALLKDINNKEKLIFGKTIKN